MVQIYSHKRYITNNKSLEHTIEQIKELINNNDTLENFKYDGFNALNIAVMGKDLNLVSIILKKYPGLWEDIDFSYKYNLLEFATVYNKIDIIKHTINDFEIKFGDLSSLDLSFTYKIMNKEVIEWLLKKKVALNKEAITKIHYSGIQELSDDAAEFLSQEFKRLKPTLSYDEIDMMQQFIVEKTNLIYQGETRIIKEQAYYSEAKDIILLNTNTNGTIANNIGKMLTLISSKSTYAKDIIDVIALSISKGNNNKLNLIEVEYKGEDSSYSSEHRLVNSEVDFLHYKTSLATLTHEMGHMFFDNIFNNDCNPYPSNNQELYHSFNKAKYLTFKNFIKNILKIDSELNEDTYESIEDAILSLRQSFPSEIKDLFFTTLFYDYEQYGSEIPWELIGREDQLSDEENLKFYQQWYEPLKFKYTDQELLIINRIGNWIFAYPESSNDKELIVRLPELENYELSSEYMSIFDPLREFWDQHISPRVEQLKQEHMQDCLSSKDGSLHLLIPEESATIYCLGEFITNYN